MSKDELQIDVTGADATETTETFKATEAGEVVEAATETVVQEQDFPETLVMEAETIKESISDSAATPATPSFTPSPQGSASHSAPGAASYRTPPPASGTSSGPYAPPMSSAAPGAPTFGAHAPSTLESASVRLGRKSTDGPIRVGLLIWSAILIIFGLLVLIGGLAGPLSFQGLVTALLALAGVAFIGLAIMEKQKGS